jgi:hypothetical protein
MREPRRPPRQAQLKCWAQAERRACRRGRGCACTSERRGGARGGAGAAEHAGERRALFSEERGRRLCGSGGDSGACDGFRRECSPRSREARPGAARGLRYDLVLARGAALLGLRGRARAAARLRESAEEA